LENGKDYFITVSGKYLVSSFGNTLDFLVRTPNPVRASSPLFPSPTHSPSPAARNPQPAQPAGDGGEQKLSIPKELWRLVDYIYKKGMLEVCFFFHFPSLLSLFPFPFLINNLLNIFQEGLFLQSGVQKEMEIIRECLDTGESFSAHSIILFFLFSISFF
jgi:phosphatidylinositol-bisphosphatase